MAHKFQKLDIDLPRQPLSDQKVWMVAGWLFAALVILFTLFSYLDYKNSDSDTNEQEIQNTSRINKDARSGLSIQY